MFKISTNNMENAFKFVHTNIIAPNNDSPDALEIAKSKGKVVSNYVQTWQEFFLNWKGKQSEQFQYLVEFNEQLHERDKQLHESLEIAESRSKKVEQYIEELVQSKRKREKFQQEKKRKKG